MQEKTIDGVTYVATPVNAGNSCRGCHADGTDLCGQLRTRDYCQLPEIHWYRKEHAPAGPDTKATNPKQAIGDTKAPLHLVPAAAMVHESAAYAEGALKYGANNWRVAGVRVTTYVAATLRHVMKYYNGERCDPQSRVHHLGNARACLGIMLDAEAHGMLNDDRPPAQDLAHTVREVEEILAHLKELHKDCNPHHHTQKDFE